jgi:hypothetical protein
MQVYGYAKEADELKIPALIFIGEQEQYQRRRSIEEAVKNLELLKRPVRLIVYPGVGRGFDFRPPNVRTFADDLASKERTAASSFMQPCRNSHPLATPGMCEVPLTGIASRRYDCGGRGTQAGIAR